LCNENSETLEHLTRCKELTPSWEKIFAKATTQVFNKLNKTTNSKRKLDAKNFINMFSPFTKYRNTSTSSNINKKVENTKTEMYEWLKGVFKPHLLETMKSFFPTGNVGLNAITHITKKLLKSFKKEIWPERCKINKEKEEKQLHSATTPKPRSKGNPRTELPTREEAHNVRKGNNAKNAKNRPKRSEIRREKRKKRNCLEKKIDKRGRTILEKEDKSEWARGETKRVIEGKIKGNFIEKCNLVGKKIKGLFKLKSFCNTDNITKEKKFAREK
jgi:hypothetical protein